LAAARAKSVTRQVVHVGSGRETSIRELADLVEEVTGRRTNRVVNRSKQGGVERLVADIGRARDLLAWQPQVTLADGLATMIATDRRFRGQETALSK
jgi:nucleoside-diphosphate-sugar epimerase